MFRHYCVNLRELVISTLSSYINTVKVYFILFCAVTNKFIIISLIITLLHVSTLLCQPQGACNQYLVKLHKYG